MWEDPIVAEIHRIREKLAAKFGFDVNAIFADLQKRQEALGDRLVSPRNQDASLHEPVVEAERGGSFDPPGAVPPEAAPTT